MAERADKDRFFKEPGFIFGVAVCRPKVYLTKQKAVAVSMMTDAYSWLPAVLQDQAYTSLKKFAATSGPLAGQIGASPANDYWVDLRDLFVYGDQFVNFDIATAADAAGINLPSVTGTLLQKRFATAADADLMFKTPATANRIRADGVVSLNIHSRIVDTTL